MEIVIFIESNTSGTGEIFLQKVIQYNYMPIFLTANPNLYSFLNSMPKVKVIEMNTMDSSAILDICNSYIKDGNVIKGIISVSYTHLRAHETS